MQRALPPTMVAVLPKKSLQVQIEAGPMAGVRAGLLCTWHSGQALLLAHHKPQLQTAAT